MANIRIIVVRLGLGGGSGLSASNFDTTCLTVFFSIVLIVAVTSLLYFFQSTQ